MLLRSNPASFENDPLAFSPQNPSMIGFFATIAAFLIIIYAEGIRVELPLSHADYKGFRSRYPIKLLYVSNLPVIFASALFANVYFFSQLFWSMNGQPSPGTTFSWIFWDNTNGKGQAIINNLNQ